MLDKIIITVHYQFDIRLDIDVHQQIVSQAKFNDFVKRWNAFIWKSIPGEN